jgi:hypothetical protein
MKATAIVVGADDNPGTTLTDLALLVGFEAVVGYQSVGAAERQAERTPLIFFLFAATEDRKRLKQVANAVRFSTSNRVRFAPMIYFADNPSLEVIRSCVNMGFDDVITLPFTRDRVVARLSRQVEHTLTYYETGTYFGPDRRGLLPEGGEKQGRGGGGQYRRLEISRDPEAGVHVLRDDLHVMV